MAELLDRLTQDHRHLVRVLDLLNGLLDQFHTGGEPDYGLMCEMLAYMESYADQVHHPNEEDIFDRLRARTDESYPVLDRLTDQHLRLTRINRRFRQSLEGIVHEEVLRRDQVEVQGRELVQTLREHLSLEECEAFPLARECLSANDWDQLLATTASDEDPLFGPAERRRFHTLCQYLTERDRL